ncbi:MULTISPECIES: hypothetical protein [Catellatospora]|uniref:Uncharacterized protein n=1 Tax=Catellatospora chokoriensis TaxID=310353 RepID=A0A8J3JZS6_9ACTN|nr:hypothetical protein [Catellatospora chokoriensis]GIF87903.1 hypothetical protein Cch02nite_13470 [Catellatospora chokoriensis]
MTGLFASIGVDLAREDLRQFTMSVVTAGVAVTLSRRFCDHVWTDASGARVIARARWGRIHHMQPSLAGGAVAVACANIRLIDDRTAVMDLLDETDGGLVCPVAVHLEDHTALHVAGGGLARGQVTLSALAETVEPPPADEPAATTPRGLICDDLVRPGLAEPGWTPTARARLRGTVRLAELRTNTLTGEQFHWLRLRVHPHIDIDVAAPASTLPTSPSPGAPLRATATLTGRLDLQPHTLRKGRAPSYRSA